MSIMRTLGHPETIETKQGIKKVTHEVYSYAITPFQNPPIKVHVYKGTFDSVGHFQVLVDTQTTIEISQEEFRWLLNPTPNGKPAGDFRLSDVWSVLKRRHEKAEVKPPTTENASVPEKASEPPVDKSGQAVDNPKDPEMKPNEA